MGYKNHKTILPLPILKILNIERTVIFLNEFGIFEIIILVNNESLTQFQYLHEVYSCSIIYPMFITHFLPLHIF